MASPQAETLAQDTLLNLARQALERFDAPLRGDVRLLCQSENATYVVESGSEQYALRLHRGNYHDRETIEGELAWLASLRESGIAVPVPVETLDGERVQTLTEPGGEQRHAVMFHWIPGEMPTNAVDPEAFRELGRITAALHHHSRRWEPPAGFRRIVWNHQTMVGADGHWGDWRDAPNLRREDWPVIEAAIERIAATLDGYGQDPARFGLIHADLRLTNLLLDGGSTRVIDFDDCGFGWYMHDLAAALSFEEHHPQAPVWLECWLAGYAEVAPLSAADRDVIPALIAQRRIQLLAWTGSHADTEQTRELGPHWADESVRLVRRYLDGALPLGA
ncbi:phosphotransferase enzyme family protein [Salinicola aestuarinus]|uniref:phosphotransferase enzyme family protein n=1 Tax=Salinicola aestuarinus TaxID=1949082 RepID=UPI000DA10BB8|nr:phosphotransferase [Salinicola aestuarinus]